MDPEVHEQCVLETVRLLQGLEPGLPDDEIVARRMPWKVVGRAVEIHPGESVHPVKERYARGTNQSEDIGYGVQVTSVTPKDASLKDGIGKPSARRSQVRRLFIHQKPANLTLTSALYLTTTVEPGELFDAPRGIERYDVHSVIIRYWVRETRP